jgi:TatD DNase family protein
VELIDSHSHIDVAEFDTDRDAVLERALAAGVVAQIVPAVEFATWAQLAALCRQRPELAPAYGLHPMYLAHHRSEHLEALERWIADQHPVAVGECGLDFFVEYLDPTEQRRYFLRQLEIARAADLPVILHARRAVDEVIATLRRVGGLRGVVHSYSGSAEQARQLWHLGFHLGIGGPITYERASRLRALVATMPLDQLLLETDAPDQPLAAWRGQRNEPARLPEVLSVVAQVRGETPERIAAATCANARRLFALNAARTC